ncbi:MAG: glycosyltransferase family 39 protein [Proteobacteria bacterium]|nr:glycosyltransferase family 39 protein [Pseudomonadota bacterium]
MKKDPLAILIVMFVIAAAGAKLWFAAHLDLHYDEAYYWHEAWHPAFGFSTGPYLRSLLSRAGLELIGDSALGLRLMAWLLGSSIPIAVYFLAEPVVGRRDAIYAAGLTMAVPMLGLMGIVSYEQFLFFAVAGLAAFERAVRTDRMRYWILTGLLIGLGLAVHYRMVMVVFALFVYLVLTARARAAWRRPGVYVAGAAIFMLSVPTLIDIFLGDAAAVSFLFFERHPWRFQPRQLLYPIIQMLVVTPPLFVLLAAGLARAVRAARMGNDQARLLAVFTITIIAIYFPLVTVADATRLNIHWVLPAYVPLLVFAPALLRRFRREGQALVPGWLNRPIALLTPGLGIAIVLSAFAGLAILSGPTERMPERLLRQTSIEFMGWSGFVTAAERFYRAFPGEPPIVVASDYRVGAQFAFGIGLRQDVYVLDLSGRNDRDKVGVQY